MPENKHVVPKICTFCGGPVLQDYRAPQVPMRGCGPGFYDRAVIKDGSHCEGCGVKFVFNVEEKGDE